jgi:hypothetical protein
MEKINKFVLIAITVAVSISFVFSTTSLAKSNLPEVFLRTRNLSLGYRTSGFFNNGKDDYDRDVQYSYYRKLFLGADNMPWKCSTPRSIAKNSFDKAVRDGNLVITQTSYSGYVVFGDKASTYDVGYTLHFFWSEEKLPTQKLNYNKYYSYHFADPTKFNSLSMTVIPGNSGVRCDLGGLRDQSQVILSQKRHEPNIDAQTAVFISDVKYELGDGLEGVDINDLFIPENFEEKLQPDFMWMLDNKLKLRVTYMKNVKEFEDPKYPKLSDYLKWHYVLRESDEKRADGKVVDDSKNGINYGYQYTLPTKQFYKLEITLDDSDIPLVWNPRPDFSYIKKRTFFINADGKSHFGDTFSNNCDVDGVCVENFRQIRCEDMNDMLDRVSCRMNENFSGGVLNPSLLAVRKLVSSLAVPDPPKCGIDIPPIADRRFQAFNPSNVVADACVRTKAFRQSFPLSIVAINFSAAIFWLWLIVRIFNKLTSHKDDDMIGEV